MGKSSIEYKRRLRQKQRRRKRGKGYDKPGLIPSEGSLTSRAPSLNADSDSSMLEATSEESGSGPGCMPFEGNQTSVTDFLPSMKGDSPTSKEPDQEKQKTRLLERLEKTTKRMKYYQDQLEEQKLVVDTMEEACMERIRSV